MIPLVLTVQAEAANRRAEALLERHLTWFQRLCWKRDRCFYVKGKDSGILYEIREQFSAWSHTTVIERKSSSAWCLMVYGDELASQSWRRVPAADEALVKKLMIEANEALFRVVAHRWNSDDRNRVRSSAAAIAEIEAAVRRYYPSGRVPSHGILSWFRF